MPGVLPVHRVRHASSRDATTRDCEPLALGEHIDEGLRGLEIENVAVELARDLAEEPCRVTRLVEQRCRHRTPPRSTVRRHAAAGRIRGSGLTTLHERTLACNPIAENSRYFGSVPIIPVCISGAARRGGSRGWVGTRG